MVTKARAEVIEPAPDSIPGARADQRLEPPLPRSIEMQHVVVIGQVKRGEWRRSRRSHGEIFDETAEPVPQPPKPAAADSVFQTRVLVQLRQPIEQRERIGLG